MIRATRDKYLLDKLTYFTECNLATLEELEILRSSSLARKTRQKKICEQMVATCNAYVEEPEKLRNLPRLRKALENLRKGQVPHLPPNEGDSAG